MSPGRRPQAVLQSSLNVITKACGVCHSDCLVKYEVMPVLPRVPGHEVIGEVVAVGDRVHNIKVGERVGGGWVSRKAGAKVEGRSELTCLPTFATISTDTSETKPRLSQREAVS